MVTSAAVPVKKASSAVNRSSEERSVSLVSMPSSSLASFMMVSLVMPAKIVPSLGVRSWLFFTRKMFSPGPSATLFSKSRRRASW